MATTTGVEPVASFEDAVALALAESGQASLDEPDFVLPTIEDETDASIDQAISESDDLDQPTVDEFDFDADEPAGETEKESTSDLNLDEPRFEVNGAKRSVKELMLGYQRMEDYTKKTQEVAQMRADLEAAGAVTDKGSADLWRALKEDPAGTVAYLAVQVGLLDEGEAGSRISSVKSVKVRSDADIEAEVQAKLAEAVKSHPDVQAAMADRVRMGIDRSFAAIEQKIQKPLSEKAKIKVMQFAVDHQLADLELAFDALSARVTGSTKSVKAVQPQKRTVSGGQAPEPIVVNSFDDAVAAAYAQLRAADKV
jgi:hypothetical protein